MLLISFTWFVWLWAAAGAKKIAYLRKGLASGGVDVFPTLSVMPLLLWGLSFLLPHGMLIVGVAHGVLLVVLLLAGVRYIRILRSMGHDDSYGWPESRP